MRYGNWLIPILALLLAALIMSACSGSDESSSGVARIEDTQPAEPEIKSAGPSNPPADTPVPLASEADTVPTEDVPGLQAMAKETVDQELIPVDE